MAHAALSPALMLARISSAVEVAQSSRRWSALPAPVQQAFNVQTGIADINLLVRVHVPLQLHAVVLLRVDRATNLRSCLQFRNGPAKLHTPQSEREACFCDVDVNACQRSRDFTQPVLPLAFGVPAAANVVLVNELISSAIETSSRNWISRDRGEIHQRQIQCLIKTLQLMDKKGTSAVDCCPGQMSLAFAISLNIEGQLNVAAGIAGAIEESVSDLDGIRTIGGSEERAERAGSGRRSHAHINRAVQCNAGCVSAKVYRDVATYRGNRR